MSCSKGLLAFSSLETIGNIEVTIFSILSLTSAADISPALLLGSLVVISSSNSVVVLIGINCLL